ncbi:hypothetical protein TrLO_g6122 [Triparma laevis f. longispina]|uniref:Uncharacterized protein n=1 Tax=Triparma laevis f. longispina TaxID=1714387 RepID=A0A9W6ZZP5_9STRA|nr:hypothetical protein TrLO_g6122 [Triparma laevis f. longispina]
MLRSMARGSSARLSSRLLRTQPVPVRKYLLSRTPVPSSFALPPARFLSTTASNPSAKKSSDSKKSADDDDSNVFLDNLGKIFGLCILSIVLMVVRSSRGGTNRGNVRDEIEDTSVLDPVEIEDMRSLNEEFSPVLFRLVTSAVYSKYPTECTYKQFLSTTMSTLRKATSDPTFSIQLGHNIDRVVFTFPQYHDEKAYPNSLFLTVLTMAVYSTVQERIKLIYEVAAQQENKPPTDKVSSTITSKIVQHLADTCQLPPENQVIEVGSPYPIQQYEKATGEQMVKCVRKPYKDKNPELTYAAVGGGGEDVDLEQWEKIMKSRLGPCPWGECYVGFRRFA